MKPEPGSLNPLPFKEKGTILNNFNSQHYGRTESTVPLNTWICNSYQMIFTHYPRRSVHKREMIWSNQTKVGAGPMLQNEMAFTERLKMPSSKHLIIFHSSTSAMYNIK